MQYMALKTYLLPAIVTLVYSLNTWSAVSDSSPRNAIEVDGRIIYFDEKISKAVRENLLNGVNALISQDSPDLKGIDLEELKARTQKIIVAASDGKLFVGSGYRNGAVNFAEEGTVLYNYEKIKSYTQTQRSLNQWHEALGAMGYRDDNYLLSTSIVQKISLPNKPLHPQIQDRFKKQMNEAKLVRNEVWKEVDGGVSGVGGGGDGDMAEIKWALLSYLDLLATQNELGSSTDSKNLIDLAIDTPVESIEFRSKYQGLIQFRQISIGVNRFNGKVCLLVDPKDWQPVDQTKGVVSERDTKLIFQIVLVLKTILQTGGPF